MRAFKSVNDNYIEPISFIVPRRAEVFQGDIYPPVTGTKPAMSSAQWFDGGDALPPKIDLESVYAGEEPAEIASDYKPRPLTPPKAPAEIKNEPEPVKEAPQPSPAFRGPLPSMKEQTTSVAALASKFADKDPDDSVEDDDTSSFEEIPKPVDRSEKQIRVPPAVDKTQLAGIQKGLDSPVDHHAFSAVEPASSARPDPQMIKVQQLLHTIYPDADFLQPKNLDPPSVATSTSTTMNLPPTPAARTEPIQGYLQEIKALLQQQTQTMAQQSAKIGQLTAEVDDLKTNLSTTTLSGRLGGANKGERIKRLEEELAELRS